MWRLWTTFALLIFGFLITTVRLFYWQVLAYDDLKRQAQAQHFLELTLPSDRGKILGADGEPLVINQLSYLVYAQPKDITDIPTVAAKIADVLSKPKDDILEQLSQPERLWVPLAHKVESPVVDKLKKLNIAGIGFEREPKRYYPEASGAAHLLGFVGNDQNGNDKGYFGVEGYYDRELRGKSGAITMEKDVHGAPIVFGEAKRIEPDNGRDLILWLDRTVQMIAESRLSEGIRKYGATEGSVVIMDPKTGGIMAMASYPSYDPRTYSSFDKALYKNPVVAGSYEPGSTFKTLIMSAAINEGVISPLTMMNEDGPVRIGEYQVRTWNNQYHGQITMTQVLEHSSNVGMVHVSRKLGNEKMLSFIKGFGFGKATGVDLEDETSPDLRADSEWKEIDFATASFGQGIAVTPIQMVRAVSALANDGWLMQPAVVREEIDSRGKKIEIKPKRLKQVVSTKTARLITEMMVAAVEKGEAKWAKPKGYRVAGKTGTAQIPVEGHYDDKKTIASFIGFAPADNPRFTMLVTLREPSSSPWGSETAAPLFFTIAKDIFLYLGIPATQ